MKRIMLAVALAASMSMAGCATTGAGTNGIGSQVSLATADEKALLAVELSWRATLVAVNAAVDGGVLKGQRAADVRTALATAKRGVDAARKAYDTGQNVQAMARIGEAASALAQVRSLLGR